MMKILRIFEQTLSLAPRRPKLLFSTNHTVPRLLYSKKTYNTPHPPRDPPDDWNPDKICHDGFEAPEFLPKAVFRKLKSDDCLGPGASKCESYKNSEYFAYHRFTFAELARRTQELREQRVIDVECEKIRKKEEEERRKKEEEERKKKEEEEKKACEEKKKKEEEEKKACDEKQKKEEEEKKACEEKQKKEEENKESCDEKKKKEEEDKKKEAEILCQTKTEQIKKEDPTNNQGNTIVSKECKSVESSEKKQEEPCQKSEVDATIKEEKPCQKEEEKPKDEK